ncbi:MAG TPA: poly(R)-hydroxyalkanoic acid synthase subunit PhaE, partial [Paraburkholderia sp.]
SEPGRQIDSIRALYDLWVDAAEEAYAEIALSDDFRKVYGDVVNSQMRVRSQMQQEVERIGVDLGMPTRSELNSVHKRLHDMRRELRDSQEALRNTNSDGRDAEIAAMRAEIDDLRRLVTNLGPRAVPVRPTAVVIAKKAAASRKRARRKPARSKRVAAKRAHVAAKTTSVGMPRVAFRPEVAPTPSAKAPGKPLAPKAVTVRIVPKPAKRPGAATRRALQRNALPVKTATEVSKSSKSSPQKRSSGAPVSFGDAIAAMRRDLVKPGGRKLRAARVFQPFQSESVIRIRRSKP